LLAGEGIESMKCQECEKPSTFHITEITESGFQEIHLCEDHAKNYLAQSSGPAPVAAASLAGALAHQLKLGQTAEELARLDQEACPVCGITFYEFRSQGRLGCPNDYICFSEQLEPLLVNIHGATEHVGKSPRRSAAVSQQQTDLIRLRREMKVAVEREHYEQASQLRDQISEVEAQLKVKPPEDDG